MNYRANEDYLYLQIADSIRRDIENGTLKRGAALPPIRSLTSIWHCTIGTVQRAIQELANEGLVSTHVGQRTRVIAPVSAEQKDTLRRANLIHRAETFLLDVMTSGYEAGEAEDAFRIALNRWQAVSQAQPRTGLKTLRFAGSHDLAVAWIATHFGEIIPGYQLHLEFTGSLSGLHSFAEGKADISGSHLWDAQTGEYNVPTIHSLLPNEPIALITLAHRQVGFMVQPGNPKSVTRFEDLVRSDVRLINRNPGSGTRIYLDARLHEVGIDPGTLRGYAVERMTHSEVAAEIAEGHADVGIGLEAAAKAYGLDFIFLTRERYDLVVRQRTFQLPAIQALTAWLKADAFHQLLHQLGGYDAQESGIIRWVSPE